MEAKLAELVNRLKSASGENLETVVLYGSAASGEFHLGHSDLNVLCVVKHAGVADLDRLRPVGAWWVGEGNHAPLIFTATELKRSSDVFAIELLDMKRHHRILFGQDFLAGFDVPLDLHRLQVERELRVNWLRLRQAILTAPDTPKARLGIMQQSVSPFCALFRHAVVALGGPMPASKAEAVAAIAALTGGDPSAFNDLLAARAGTRKMAELDVAASLRRYLDFVEVVTNEVDRRLDLTTT